MSNLPGFLGLLFLFLNCSLAQNNNKRTFPLLPCIQCTPLSRKQDTPRLLPISNSFMRLFGISYVPSCCSQIPTFTISFSPLWNLFTPKPTKPPQVIATTQDPSRLYNTSMCGTANNRVINGQPVNENQFPWMCSILFSDNTWYGCGATLISCDPVIIVSAAHCFYGLSSFSISTLRVACGDHVSK